MPIPFIDLKAQRQQIDGRIEKAIDAVFAHGHFILGPEVHELENALAEFVGAKQCVTCANGTDALQLVLMAEGIGKGDAVLVPDFTFIATAEVVRLAGATPIFCDVCPDTFNLNPKSLEIGIEYAKTLGLLARMVIAVDLFGQPANYNMINQLAYDNHLIVVADAAQSFGATYCGATVGNLTNYTTTSFFPAKPLGCYGDGGAVFVNDENKATVLRSLRSHGKGAHKYEHVHVGFNSRLDTIQAAILLEKLKIFPKEIKLRQNIAKRYTQTLSPFFQTPYLDKNLTSVWAQYTIQTENRDMCIEKCKAAGVPVAIYYPIPLSQQTGYQNCPSIPGGMPVAKNLARTVLSLPMHPYLDNKTQDFITDILCGIGAAITDDVATGAIA